MAEPSLEVLAKTIREILTGADLTAATNKKVRLELEKRLGMDLSDRKEEINKMIVKIMVECTKATSEEEPKKKEEESESEENGNDKKRDSTSSSSSADEAEENHVEKDEELARKLQEEDGKRLTRNAHKRPAAKKKPISRKRVRDSDSDDGSDTEIKKKSSKRKGNNGYTKSIRLSEALGSFVGSSEMPRHEVVKKMWAYVKENNLQDPKNRQFALCDSSMEKIFGKKRIRMFGMMKLLKDHFYTDD